MSIYYTTAGTIVKVFRWSKFVFHYGVVTDRFTVIDHSAAGICERSFEEFTRGEEIQVVNPHDDEYSKGIVLQNALYALYHYSRTAYRLFKFNCEHFVTWCRGIKPTSKQVQVFTTVSATAGCLTLLYYLCRSND